MHLSLKTMSNIVLECLWNYRFTRGTGLLFPRPNCLKTIPLTVTHTHIAYMRECLPPGLQYPLLKSRHYTILVTFMHVLTYIEDFPRRPVQSLRLAPPKQSKQNIDQDFTTNILCMVFHWQFKILEMCEESPGIATKRNDFKSVGNWQVVKWIGHQRSIIPYPVLTKSSTVLSQVDWGSHMALGCQRWKLWHLSHGVWWLLPRLQNPRRWLSIR